MTREEAIAILKPFRDCMVDQHGCPISDAVYALDVALDALSAQQWIPVSERLPETDDYDETFIVTIQCEHVDGWPDYVTGTADWTPHGWDIQSYFLGQIKVVAWMSLPESWKGDTWRF